jgi:hypothetical protein
VELREVEVVEDSPGWKWRRPVMLSAPDFFQVLASAAEDMLELGTILWIASFHTT